MHSRPLHPGTLLGVDLQRGFGVEHRAEEIHSIALSDLHGEFAVLDAAAVIAALGTSLPARRRP
jgi:hypothetical protein